MSTMGLHVPMRALIERQTEERLETSLQHLRPAVVPPWFDDWTAPHPLDPALLAKIREVHASDPEEVVDLLIRFPPGCVVRCACNGRRCRGGKPWINGGVAQLGDGLALRLVTPEGRAVAFLNVEAAVAIGYVGGPRGLTPLLMRALLRPAGDA